MRSKRPVTVIVLGALALALFQFGGCLQSSTEPNTAATQATAASTPNLDQIRQSVEMTDAQASKLGSAVDRWQKAEGDAPDLEFFAASAQILQRDQLRQLVQFVGEHRAERFQSMRQQRQQNAGNCPGGPANCPNGMGAGAGMGPGAGMEPGAGMGRHAGGFRGPGPDFGDLNLTAEQLEALRAARMEMHTVVQTAHEQFRNGSLTEEQLRAAMDTARETFEAALQEILTLEQLAQLQQNRVDHFVQMIQHRIERHEQTAAHRLELLTQILDLSAAQVQSIQEIHDGVVPALQTILAGVQDGSLTLDAAHDALRTLQEETHDAVVAVLTPEQAELFAALRPHRGPFGPGGPGGRGA